MCTNKDIQNYKMRLFHKKIQAVKDCILLQRYHRNNIQLQKRMQSNSVYNSLFFMITYLTMIMCNVHLCTLSWSPYTTWFTSLYPLPSHMVLHQSIFSVNHFFATFSKIYTLIKPNDAQFSKKLSISIRFIHQDSELKQNRVIEQNVVLLGFDDFLFLSVLNIVKMFATQSVK